MRTRTPPELKWLLVERATVAGDIARLTERQILLAAELACQRATLQALDATIHLTEFPVAPNAAGVIRSFAKEYGKRGALKEFIIATLQAAPVSGISTAAITQGASDHFGLNFATKAEFGIFQENSVRSQVKLLRKQGFVEVIPLESTSHSSGFRWKSQLPTLSELAVLAAANR